MSIQLEDALEISLQRLQTGADPDGDLADFDEQAAELAPLVNTARLVAELAADVQIPAGAQSRSRAQFLTAAAALPPTTRRWQFSFFHLRLAASSMILAGFVALGLLGTGLASAAALPGDMLYPVKRMVEDIQINLAPAPIVRLQLEENLDDRRLEEATRLTEINRREFVTFGGILRQTTDDRWMVGDLVVEFPANTPVAPIVDQYVQVSGYSDARQVEVEEIQPRSYTWDGLIQKIESGTWWVGGIQVNLDSSTRLTGDSPKVGALVHVTAIRRSDDRYLALTLEVAVSPVPSITRGATKAQPTPSRSPSKGPTQVITKAATEEPKKTEAHDPTRTSTPKVSRTPTAPVRTTTTPSEKENSTTRVPSATRISSTTRVPSQTPQPEEHH